jgi:5'-nucleotidase/UDP-sugar diphosphatase
MRRLLLAAFLIFPLILMGQKKGEYKVYILHTNDMHGKIDQFPKIKAIVAGYEAKTKDVFLLSAGDMFSGNPVVDQYTDRGFPMVDLMNWLGYDLAVLGNHEFDYGKEFLKKRMSQAGFKLIAANMNPTDKTFPNPEPYHVLLTSRGHEIFVLGLTQTGESGFPDTHPEKTKDFTFQNGLDVTADFLDEAKKADMFVVLSHMGVEKDSALAKKYPQIDLIIGGHSHKILYPPSMVNGVMMVQAGSGLKCLGIIEITFNKKGDFRLHDTLIYIKEYPYSDSTISKIVRDYNLNSGFEKEAGINPDTILGDDELGSMMSDAFRISTGADFAFQNAGGIRVHEWPKGTITQKMVFELDPFGNDLMLFEMTADEIEGLIISGYLKEGGIDLLPSGLMYKMGADSSGKEVRLEILDVSGRPLNKSLTYKVALNSYVAASYKFSSAKPPVYMGKTTTEAILDYVRTGIPVYRGTIRTGTLRD